MAFHRPEKNHMNNTAANAPFAPLIPPETGRIPYKWKVLISVVFGIFMIIIDSTVVNVAFRTPAA